MEIKQATGRDLYAWTLRSGFEWLFVRPTGYGTNGWFVIELWSWHKGSKEGKSRTKRRMGYP
jgi:hypothetical protein